MSVQHGVSWVLTAVAVLAWDARWLRTAQREHYIPGSVSRLALLWARRSLAGVPLLVLSIVLLILGLAFPIAAIAGTLCLIAWPIGLAVRGRGRALALTPRLIRLGVLVLIVQAALMVLAWSSGRAAFVPLVTTLLIDAALAILAPVERWRSSRFVRQAAEQIRRVKPLIVGITGSYGKTSTKNYTAHLLSESKHVVASPASFNNLLGLSRAVNERLVRGTEVFVAEMGTYGPGEIAEICAVLPPDVAAIVTIGEAHLERMKDRATILRAKTEIMADANVVVLNVDVPELRVLADELATRRTVLRASATKTDGADVAVLADDSTWTVWSEGQQVATVASPPSTGHPINLAVAAAIARGVGVPTEAWLKRLDTLPQPAHRASLHTNEAGVVVVDDTYNSNPDGAQRAIETAQNLAGDTGSVYTVTPGIIELGAEQVRRNGELAAVATATSRMHLCVVGRTNRRALVDGARSADQVAAFRNRQAASDFAFSAARAGDVVVFENDLPDHYP